MAVTKAQQNAVAKYNSKAYDRIELKVPKGSKVNMKTHADAHGESLNRFINRAITETVERDSKES